MLLLSFQIKRIFKKITKLQCLMQCFLEEEFCIAILALVLTVGVKIRSIPAICTVCDIASTVCAISSTN